MKEYTVFNGSIGLNNKITPHRLPYTDDGVSALEHAMNVYIDETGELVSAKGRRKVKDGVFHSTFETVDGFYVVQDLEASSSLFRAVPDAAGDLTLIGIRSAMTKGRRVYYHELDGRVYYSNGIDNGFLTLDDSYPWPTSEWVGQDEDNSKVTFPVGKNLDMLSGRFLCSIGKELFFTEVNLVGLYDEVAGRRAFESDITMICAVSTGVFVSDENSVYFLRGTNPKEWIMERVLNYPAYRKYQHLVDPSKFGFQSLTMAGLFATEKGAVIGMADGTAQNLIDDNVITPECNDGCINVVGDSMILQS